MNQNLLAQATSICNPVLTRFGGCNGNTDSGGLLGEIIVTLWLTLLTLGGLAVLIFMIWGGVSWLTAGGDKAKVEDARNKITNALIGMTILFAVIAFTNFLGPILGFDILNLSFPTPGDFN